jgi:uncharacterized membrane protein YiaA
MNTLFYIIIVNLIAFIPAIIGFGLVSLFLKPNQMLFNLYFGVGYFIVALIFVLISIYLNRKKTKTRLNNIFLSISFIDLVFAFVWGIIFSSIVLWLYPISSRRNIIDFVFVAFVIFVFVANWRDKMKDFLRKRGKKKV